jgi:hypothetical protein
VQRGKLEEECTKQAPDPLATTCIWRGPICRFDRKTENQSRAAAAPDKVMAVAKIATKVWIPAPAAAAACDSVPRLSLHALRRPRGRTDGRTDEETDEPTNGRPDERINERTDEQTVERTDVRMHTFNLNTCLWPKKNYTWRKFTDFSVFNCQFIFLICQIIS